MTPNHEYIQERCEIYGIPKRQCAFGHAQYVVIVKSGILSLFRANMILDA